MTRTSHATLRYTAARLGLFAGCFVAVAVLAYVGVLPEGIGESNPLWIVLLALIISALLSTVLLRRQREAMAEQVAGGVHRARGKLAANRSMEDSVTETTAAETTAAEGSERQGTADTAAATDDSAGTSEDGADAADTDTANTRSGTAADNGTDSDVSATSKQRV
ncbi:DUF4229 domain-containing protein [Streptomyces oceani]|uniref:DUF4229 domain-containing protein n=1 Tax=Streptomyces oceani TaxID=1075402 RepID=UPI0008720998